LTSRFRVALAALSLSASIAAAQQPDINGIPLGMPLDQAKAKLAGFTFTPIRVQYLPDLQVVVAIKGTKEAFMLEAMGGKVAVIHRVVQLTPSEAIDGPNYYRQILAKYGNPTAPDADYQGPNYWLWDASNSLLQPSSHQRPENCTASFQDSTVLDHIPDLPDDGNALHKPEVVMRVLNKDEPSCHVKLSVMLERGRGDEPARAIDRISFWLGDPSMFYPAVRREIDKQKAAADARAKASQQRSGPPL
jgi:hypothetical protein